MADIGEGLGMTTSSELFPQASSLPGGMTKDPRLLPCHDGTNACQLEGGSFTQSNAGGFWVDFDKIGSFSTSSTDDTYTEICDITGSGIMFHVLSQTITNLTDDVTFRITVDGVEYVIAKTQTWNTAGDDGGRVVLGAATAAPNRYTTAVVWYGEYAGTTSGGSTQAFNRSAGAALLIPPQEIMINSWPCLRFEESLKVEVKVTDVFPGTYGPRCGVSYILD